MVSERKKELNRQKYNYAKEHGICVKCFVEMAVPGRVRCETCLDKANKAAEKYRKTHDMHERNHAMREKRKAEHRCVSCGKSKLYNGSMYCIDCYIKRRRDVLNRPRKGWKESGLCLRCGDVPKPGYKYCERCYEQVVSAGLYGVQVRKQKI